MLVASSVPDFIVSGAPDAPVFVFRPHMLKRAAAWFRDRFPGDTFYALKSNPAAHIVDALYAEGITGFDVASQHEVSSIATRYPDAKLAFMHPIKNRNAIAEAYNVHGVRRFVLDSFAELEKIREATDFAHDLTLVVRVGVSNAGATVPLTGKFGASQTEAPALLRATRSCCAQLGVSFHVGSQALNPVAWQTAMAEVSRLIAEAAVTVDIVDVGGGFPARYGNGGLPAMESYLGYIEDAFEDMMVLESAQLWCEPGRALVADCESLLVRVEGVKPGALYLNDGGFGALYDAVHLGWQFPVRPLRRDGSQATGPLQPFKLYGPTCDSSDVLPEPIWLPATLEEGDYLEFGTMGAYGRTMATRFNGFGAYETISAGDSPFMSAFDEDYAQPGSIEMTRARPERLKLVSRRGSGADRVM